MRPSRFFPLAVLFLAAWLPPGCSQQAPAPGAPPARPPVVLKAPVLDGGKPAVDTGDEGLTIDPRGKVPAEVTARQKYDEALAEALGLLAERKYPEALAALQAARTFNDTEF